MLPSTTFEVLKALAQVNRCAAGETRTSQL
jgi:hypothetical protein